jgi:formylglycine-generating enzyme required for sulfatase activity
LRLIYAVGQLFEADHRPREEKVDFLRMQCLAIGASVGLLGNSRSEAAQRLASAFMDALPAGWCDMHGATAGLFNASATQVKVGDTVLLPVSGDFRCTVGSRSVEISSFGRPSWAQSIDIDANRQVARLPDGRELIWRPLSGLLSVDHSPEALQGALVSGAWCDEASGANLRAGRPAHTLFNLPWASKAGFDQYGEFAEFTVQGRSGPVTQRLRWIPPGEFWMGSPEAEAAREANGEYAETLHRVLLSQGFWLADTACTQALWEAVLGKNPSGFNDDPSNPVEQVSWNDIQEKFLPALNQLVPGLGAGLPSEAQWEYACRAGTQTPFWFGEQVTPEQVNYDGDRPYAGGEKGEFRGKTVPAKSLPANGWGLYEMHGNVWEWCEDVLGDYPSKAVVDPVGPQDRVVGRQRVLRGGGWDYYGWSCRSARRRANVPGDRLVDIGFRLARGLGVPPPAGQGAGGARGQQADPVAPKRSAKAEAGTGAKTRKGAA